MSLSEQACVPCRGGIAALTADEIAPLAAQVDQWTVVRDHHLKKDFTFPNFASALAFVNAVGTIAEAQGHHPDMSLTWGRVGVTIWTHKIDGLTESDFILAAKIDATTRGPVSERVSHPVHQRVSNRHHPVEKPVGVLGRLDTAVKNLNGPFTHGVEQRLPRAARHLRTHQDADLLQPLPFPVEGEQRADLEILRGDVERLRKLGPFCEVAEPGPTRDAVVDDEEVTLLGFTSYLDPCITSYREFRKASALNQAAVA